MKAPAYTFTKGVCPYCGSDVHLEPSTKVYRRDYGMLWVCARYPECDAYVGVHKSSNQPLGRLANAELREAKIQAHAYFDFLWKKKQRIHGGKWRKKAYSWLSSEFGKEAHIGHMTVEECKRVVQLCKPYV